MKKINAMIAGADLDTLNSIAIREGVSLSGMIRRCVRHYLDCVEDGNMPQLIANCINELQQQNKVLYEISDVTQELSECLRVRE